MQFFNDGESYLPGASTEIISDYNQTYNTTLWNTTDPVVVIGTAFNGPTGVLVPLWNPEHASYVFGGTYNSTTKKEVDLVAGIKHAWDKGCRTIYGVRVGGKDLYKDFNLCTTNKYFLRVKSVYPTNSGKQAYVVYDNTEGSEKLTFYKIPDKATINERNQGLVESTNKMISTEINLDQDYGYTKDSSLVDIINLFNSNSFNNVLTLAIVDKDGLEVTTSKDVNDITLGSVFPGTYFIGRSKNATAMPIKTSVNNNFIFDKVAEANKLPYSSFDGSHFATLILNTDVSSKYPIYGQSKVLREALADVGITMVNDNDYLSVVSSTNKAFPEDSVDYEDTDLTNFEKYKLLGDGFGVTAHLVKRVTKSGVELVPKVTETPTNDENRIIGITNGIYSVIQDAPIDYRALGSSMNADTVISGKLPSASDFKVSVPSQSGILSTTDANNTPVDLLSVASVFDTADITSPAKKYSIQLKTFSAVDKITSDTLYTAELFDLVPVVESINTIDLTVKNGEKVLVGNATDGYSLYTIIDGIAVLANAADYDDGTNHSRFMIPDYTIVESKVTDNTMLFKTATIDFGTKKYAIGVNNNNLFVYSIAAGVLTPVGDYDTLKDTNWDKEESIFVYAESIPMNNNKIIISSKNYDILSLADFVDDCNNNEVLNDLFTFSLTSQGQINKDDYMAGTTVGIETYPGVADNVIDKAAIDLGKDHVVSYDYDLYIPYRTTDTFARQLAQHCTYVELKTGRTHGIIGCETITDTSLTSIAKKYNKIMDIDFNMYAKKNNSRNMLDSKNLPYNIGRNISIMCAQELVSVDSGGYSFLSNCAPAYAGMVSALDIAQSSTAQTIDVSPSYEFSHSQLVNLTNKGIVTVRNSYTKGYIITDGVTMADSSDGLKRLSATRIVGAVEQIIRSACEPYLGKTNSTVNKNSLQTAINSGLKAIKDVLLSSYEFSIVSDSTVAQYNYITINYTIVPFGEIREVRNSLTVTNSTSTTNA